MTQLSIEELNEIVQGHVTLGTLPPRGGMWAPLGRIVCDSRRVRRGEVFWGLPGSICDGSYFAEEALLRSAQGTVVAGRHVEPWAGCFSMRVRDSRQALRQLGQWSRCRFGGTVIHVHESAQASRLLGWDATRVELPALATGARGEDRVRCGRGARDGGMGCRRRVHNRGNQPSQRGTTR